MVQVTPLPFMSQNISFGKHSVTHKTVAYRHMDVPAPCLPFHCILPEMLCPVSISRGLHPSPACDRVLLVLCLFKIYLSSEQLWKIKWLWSHTEVCLLHWKREMMPLFRWKGQIHFCVLSKISFSEAYRLTIKKASHCVYKCHLPLFSFLWELQFKQPVWIVLTFCPVNC